MLTSREWLIKCRDLWACRYSVMRWSRRHRARKGPLSGELLKGDVFDTLLDAYAVTKRRRITSIRVKP